ncbi:hypothetical protein AMAG_19805 [Allomyces macrogynus ATCC 38327]|uniref:Uncharacterized protein n=1 Tax=Allomyces macrogynus (strain ATCC 38327) TaxID=578462 RepID=A0A0L0T1A8_ALLM3|nr:hypothetical protein AMAG_19805 [Allomyces macrogynus ATCC 38327]|eukprot:KNE68435.1 hypothetical protein AMAG_19805 [Allomyces macrogynus ATCC 38327]
MARSNNIFGSDDGKPTTLDGILGSILFFISLLLLFGGIALANRQGSAKEHAKEIETKYCLERGPNKDDSESVPKGQYWYAWLATKARGVTMPLSTLNQGGIAISMPPLPPPPYLTGNGKSAIAPAQYYTTTQPTGPATAPPVRARGILATGDIDENGHWVIATARCRPYDSDGNHAGVAANSKGAESLFHRVSAHAFVDPDAEPRARLEVRFPESTVAPADTQEIDEGLETVNKVLAANRPSLLVLRLFSILMLALWLGGIAIFLNASLAKSNDGMWVTGPMHWPGKKQQQIVGLDVFMLGWIVLLVGVWYEMRLAIATRLAVAQLNHPGARYRWHFCMPSPAEMKHTGQESNCTTCCRVR